MEGWVDFTGWALTVGDVNITYGAFIQSVFDFVIVAFVIFMVVKAMTKMQKKAEAAPAAKEPSAEVKLLTEIRDSLRHHQHHN